MIHLCFTEIQIIGTKAQVSPAGYDQRCTNKVTKLYSTNELTQRMYAYIHNYVRKFFVARFTIILMKRVKICQRTNPKMQSNIKCQIQLLP